MVRTNAWILRGFWTEDADSNNTMLWKIAKAYGGTTTRTSDGQVAGTSSSLTQRDPRFREARTCLRKRRLDLLTTLGMYIPGSSEHADGRCTWWGQCLNHDIGLKTDTYEMERAFDPRGTHMKYAL